MPRSADGAVSSRTGYFNATLRLTVKMYDNLKHVKLLRACEARPRRWFGLAGDLPGSLIATAAIFG